MQLEIVTKPNPILSKKSKKITRIDDGIKKLAADMEDTMRNYGNKHEAGVAIAAIQVGVPVRMTIVKFDEEYVALVNPELVKHSKEEFSDTEGCMSVPLKYGPVKRYKKIKVRALNLDGKKIEIKAEGFMARVIQHEIDHMNGNLFLEKVDKKDLYTLQDDGKLAK